jgi:hypothetical protein
MLLRGKSLHPRLLSGKLSACERNNSEPNVRCNAHPESAKLAFPRRWRRATEHFRWI